MKAKYLKALSILLTASILLTSSLQATPVYASDITEDSISKPVSAETIASDKAISYDAEENNPEIITESDNDKQTEETQDSEIKMDGPDQINDSYAASNYLESGRSSIKKLSIDELKTLYNSMGSYNKLYDIEPDIDGDDYHISKLSDEALDYAQRVINYYRTVAGLSDIQLTDTLNESAAWGALTLAINDTALTHFPEKPGIMSEDDYQKGYYATSHSNISLRAWDSLLSVISGQMNDSGSSNIDRVGHRRWLLYPNTNTMELLNNKHSLFRLDDIIPVA